MINDIEIPDWLSTEQQYTPIHDKNSFQEKTSKQVLKLLARIKQHTVKSSKTEVSAGLAIILLLFTVVLTVSARNLSFVILLLAVMIVILAFFKSNDIRSILTQTAVGVGFAILFTLPAVVFGNTKTMQIIVIKTAVTVMAVAMLNHTIRWNRISASFARIHIADTFLFVLDMMMKYLVLLGRVCSQLLEALKLRSIGKNNNKGKATGGVLGVTYLKADNMVQQTYQAMQCRGYDGKYHYYSKHKLNWLDILIVILMVLELILYIFINFMS